MLKGILQVMHRLLGLAAGVLLALLPLAAGSARYQTGFLESARGLLDQMTPEERVGQLFLVSFRGSRPTEEDPIVRLIQDHHISGVILQTENDNFVDPPDTLESARELITQLQLVELQASVEAEGPGTSPETSEAGVYVPLLVGIREEGNGAPHSQFLTGVTPLPSLMAIGATWDPALARAIGTVLGSELEALGVNLLVGPSLDVLEDPSRAQPGDLGVRAFGGDPYWVSTMGREYIAGIHEGSSGRIGVIVTHFPGQGSTDRPLEVEVATIRKSLEELKQIDLAPFFAVAALPPAEDVAVVDGLLASHIRYQGLQGNIRATTRPISLDREALELLMSLDPLPAWRDGGGIMISDSLGSRAALSRSY